MILILDFYVDEPACFGVPPYLSPYCRYAAGALVAGGIKPEQIDYLTVDQWRADNKQLKQDYELVLLISGTTVPGRYLGGKIGTVTEVFEFLDWHSKNDKESATVIGGPIRYSSPEIQRKIFEKGGWLIRGDLEFYAERLAAHPGGITSAVERLLKQSRHLVFPAKRSYDEVDRYAPRGAFLTELHPNRPYLILELETYRGCTREVFCSFCTEAFYGKPVFRSLQGIFDEVAELYAMGNRYFRLGRQADLLTYLPEMTDFRSSFPRPNPESLAKLYCGIRNVAPELKLLHLDNINPGVISTFPNESRQIIKIICENNTTGDTAAMGIESVDPAVIAANDLKCTPDEALTAIEIVNQEGAKRSQGIPKLLPGINLLHGLSAETEHTFEKNYRFLKNILDRGLLVRRINIRQVVSYKNTKIEREQRKNRKGKQSQRKHIILEKSKVEKRFIYYRDKIRKEIDHTFLKKNFPIGVVLDEVIIEAQNPGYYLARPLGSYPITIKIPTDDLQATEAKQNGRPCRVVITGFEERSIQALNYPVDLHKLGRKALETLPGLSKKQAVDLFLRLGQNRVSDTEKAAILHQSLS